MAGKNAYSVFDRFDFEYKPVGVKFMLTRPRDIPQMKGALSFCEMLREAQVTPAFYAASENHECRAGQILLGQVDPDPVFESGEIGPRLGIYNDPRANRRLYTDMPRLERNTANYTAFSSLDQTTFDPDLIILTARPGQAEIVLRAFSYRSGDAWHGRGTPVLGCAYLYLHPYVSGQINLMVTGLHHGMKARNIFPEGLLLITIPFNLIPEILENLAVMQWELPQYSWGKKTHLVKMKQIVEEIAQELDT